MRPKAFKIAVVMLACLLFAPALSTDPKGVGINDALVPPQSGGRVIYAAQHPDFPTALATAANSTLVVTTRMSISTAVTIPATTILKREGAGKLTKSGSGTITFQGFGLADPKSQSALFSGFAAGDITWSGTDYPKEISSELWDTGNTSLTDRLARADLAFPSKTVKIIAYPRTVTAAVTLSANRHLHFTRGDYPNTISTSIFAYRFQTNFTATADPGAVLHLSKVVSGGFSPVSLEVALDNIFFDGLYFLGHPAAGNHDPFSAIITGNAHKGAIRNCVFKGVTVYVAVGGYGVSGNFAENFDVYDNQWVDTPTQALAVINGKNINLYNNRFDVRGVTFSNNFVLIDIEPNMAEDRVENLSIRNNYFDMRSPGILYGNAIAVQGTATPGIKHVVVSGNRAIGHGSNAFLVAFQAYGVDDLRVTGNKFDRAVQVAFQITNCANVLVDNNDVYDSGDVTGRNSAMHIKAVANGQIVSNVLNRGNLVGRAGGIAEFEIGKTVTSSGSTLTASQSDPRFYDFWVGRTFTLNNTDYVVRTVSTATNPQTLTTTVAMGTLAAKNFLDVNVTTRSDNISIASHGHVTGSRVWLTSTGTVPAGLTAGRVYFVIRIDNNNLKLADTLAMALARTPIDITAASGAGTHSITPWLVTKFSSNTYRGNSADGITLEPTGTSRILSD